MSIEPNKLLSAIMRHGRCGALIEFAFSENGQPSPKVEITVTPELLTALAPNDILTAQDVEKALVDSGLNATPSEGQITVPAIAFFALCKEHGIDSSKLENALASEMGGAKAVSLMMQRLKGHQQSPDDKKGFGGKG